MNTINKDFCCENTELAINDIDCTLDYIKQTRYYVMSAPEYLLKKNQEWPQYKVDFCPFCGIKLPKDLVHEWFEILEKEYGITDPYDKKQKKLIPKEFMTDGWWKKRGL